MDALNHSFKLQSGMDQRYDYNIIISLILGSFMLVSLCKVNSHAYVVVSFYISLPLYYVDFAFLSLVLDIQSFATITINFS